MVGQIPAPSPNAVLGTRIFSSLEGGRSEVEGPGILVCGSSETTCKGVYTFVGDLPGDVSVAPSSTETIELLQNNSNEMVLY